MPVYVFCYNETGGSYGGRDFFVSNELIFKQRPELVINEAGKLEPTFNELVLLSKSNVVYRQHRCVYKDPSMKTKFFNPLMPGGSKKVTHT